MNKAQLRNHFLNIRHQISDADANVWSEEMAKNLRLRLRNLGFEGTIFLFSPTKGEPDLLRFFHEERWHLALPKVLGNGQMNFYLWSPSDPVVPGSFGILEPTESSVLVTPQPGDVAVIPALAVDQEGQRLGFGGGYYDRFLSDYRHVFLFTAAAVLPPCISMEPLPVEGHDQRVDFYLASH